MATVNLNWQSHLIAPPDELSETELRIQLAAAYRLIDRFGMSDMISNHISVRLPGEQDQFLINPYGLMYHEITASTLVKVDLQGNLIEESSWSVNPTGFVIHSAIHNARKDATCIVHTHTRYGMAVSTLECGLLPLTQFALEFYDRTAYHDYEGVSLSLAERDRLVSDLVEHNVMILRNHGLLTVGRTIPEAFMRMFYLEKSCEVQILAQSTGLSLIIPPEEVCQHSAAQQDLDGIGQLEWAALLRLLDREDPTYRD